jgi:hypothetical protein
MQVVHDYPNGTVTGTTTSAYVEALTIGNCAGAVIKVTNISGATKTMYYKVDGYTSASASCAATAITAQTDVTSATPVVNTDVNRPFAKVVVSVENHSDACSYQIDWIAY